MKEIAPGCRAFEQDLSAWIDGEIAPPRRAEIDAHVAGCAACSARAEELRAVDRALRDPPLPAVAADLRERLERRLSERETPAARPAPRSSRRWLAPALAAAAAALALYLMLPTPTPPGGDLAVAPGGDLDALAAEELALVLDLETIEDLPVIANLDVLERLLAAEAG